ncbi:hypothetical protein F0726_02432 [Acidithiobacillus caldus]|nr:hypothetical protein F0726_02432 [Acidithiobacillus caldus]
MQDRAAARGKIKEDKELVETNMASITIKSRKFGFPLVFAKRGKYVFVNDKPGRFCDKQIFG